MDGNQNLQAKQSAKKQNPWDTTVLKKAFPQTIVNEQSRLSKQSYQHTKKLTGNRSRIQMGKSILYYL